MSPFSISFHALRRRYRISQRELAEMMGYEQAFISGMELGKKGPPNEEFLTKLIKALNLTEDEVSELRHSVLESQRRYVLPDDTPTEVFQLFHELWSELGNLHPAQIRMMRETLRLPAQLKQVTCSKLERMHPITRLQEVQM